MNNHEFQDPPRFVFNDYVGQTSVDPVAICFLVIAIFVFLVGDRKYWFFLMGLVVCNLSSAQRLVVAGIDFNILRLVSLMGSLRCSLYAGNLVL